MWQQRHHNDRSSTQEVHSNLEEMAVSTDSTFFSFFFVNWYQSGRLVRCDGVGGGSVSLYLWLWAVPSGHSQMLHWQSVETSVLFITLKFGIYSPQPFQFLSVTSTVRPRNVLMQTPTWGSQLSCIAHRIYSSNPFEKLLRVMTASLSEWRC